MFQDVDEIEKLTKGEFVRRPNKPKGFFCQLTFPLSGFDAQGGPMARFSFVSLLATVFVVLSVATANAAPQILAVLSTGHSFSFEVRSLVFHGNLPEWGLLSH